MGELDKTFFRETIQQYPRNTDRKPRLWSHRNIQKARDILEASVNAQIAAKSPADALAELKDIRQTVRNDLRMASILVGEERDAFSIFETLNDRGLRLSLPDLLLNYLMGRADGAETRKQIRSQWDDMVESMGKQDINRFIRHMWLFKYGDLKSIDLFTALKARIETDKKSPLEFATSCTNECERYVELWNADEEHLGPAASYVRTLLRDLRIDSSMPLLLSAYGVLPKKELELVVKWVLVFIARYSIVLGFDSGGMENIFYALARDVRKSVAGITEKTTPKELATIHGGTLTLIKSTLIKNAPTDDSTMRPEAKAILRSAMRTTRRLSW